MGERKKCEVRVKGTFFSARCVMDFSWDMKTNKLFPIEEGKRQHTGSFPALDQCSNIFSSIFLLLYEINLEAT